MHKLGSYLTNTSICLAIDGLFLTNRISKIGKINLIKFINYLSLSKWAYKNM